mmetsp:Transcript_90234/g.263925  ORF Transcript_90234/g.263925 Transcript_90234/m.263925 type:complete len:342 (-) Transcript_90234:748-1773(-)
MFLVASPALGPLALLLFLLRWRPIPPLRRNVRLLFDESRLGRAVLPLDREAGVEPGRPLRVVLAVGADRLLACTLPQLLYHGCVRLALPARPVRRMPALRAAAAAPSAAAPAPAPTAAAATAAAPPPFVASGTLAAQHHLTYLRKHLIPVCELHANLQPGWDPAYHLHYLALPPAAIDADFNRHVGLLHALAEDPAVGLRALAVLGQGGQALLELPPHGRGDARQGRAEVLLLQQQALNVLADGGDHLLPRSEVPIGKPGIVQQELLQPLPQLLGRHHVADEEEAHAPDECGSGVVDDEPQLVLRVGQGEEPVHAAHEAGRLHGAPVHVHGVGGVLLDLLD